jgi:hypothetical protein
LGLYYCFDFNTTLIAGGDTVFKVAERAQVDFHVEMLDNPLSSFLVASSSISFRLSCPVLSYQCTSGYIVGMQSFEGLR